MKGAFLQIKNLDLIEIYLKQHLSPESKLRLLFFKTFVNSNNDLDFSCSSFHISTTTGYEWIDKWNKYGINGLNNKAITGRHARLTNENIESLKIELEKQSFWDISEIQELVKKMFNVELSRCRLSVILREMKMTYTKPYRKDYRRPDNAEEILIERLKDAFKQIEEDGLSDKDVVIGFLDESHPQNKANSGRSWSFNKSEMVENTTKYKVNTIGFYALNGNDALMFIEDSKDEGIAQFILEIRNQNPEPDAIIVVLDNFSSHKTKRCLEVANKLGVYLVFIPEYSPDLNPIEFVWKSVKRMISKYFIKSKQHLEDIIAYTFEAGVQTLSLACSWLNKIASAVDQLKHLNCS
jgi:transposase